MRRDFLKQLGIEDKEIIDKILDEHSSDIGKIKGELESTKNTLTEVQGQLDNKTKELEKAIADGEKVAELTKQIETLKTDHEAEIGKLKSSHTELQKTHAIENGIRNAKGRNIKAIMGVLDLSKVTMGEDGTLNGLDDQLESLKKSDETAFLFNVKESPSGTTPADNQGGGNGGVPTGLTFNDAIAKALGK